MARVNPRGVEAPTFSAGDDEYLHIVSYREWLVADVLRLKIPRALCGVLLIQDPDKRPTLSTDPSCPRCLTIAR